MANSCSHQSTVIHENSHSLNEIRPEEQMTGSDNSKRFENNLKTIASWAKVGPVISLERLWTT